LAKLSPYAPEHESRTLGGLEGQIEIADDFDEEDPFDQRRRDEVSSGVARILPGKEVMADARARVQ
jgi:hypothetical protein